MSSSANQPPDAAEQLRELFLRGLALHKAVQNAEAEAIYRQVLAVDPNFVDARQLVGVIAHQTGRHELAVKEIATAIQLDNTRFWFFLNLGAALEATGRTADAIVAYRETLRLNPQNSTAHANLGNALRNSGQLNEAVESYRQALALDANNLAATNNMGSTLLMLGRSPEAAVAFESATKIDPTSAIAHCNWANSVHDQGKFDEAIVHTRRAIEIDPKLSSAHLNLGCALLQEGEYEEARQEFATAYQLAPTDGLLIRQALSFPIISPSVQSILDRRQELANDLARLRQSSPKVNNPIDDIGCTPFRVAYQGLPNRDLQAQIADVMWRSTPSLNFTAPHCAAGTRSGGRLRIGFISRFFYDHPVGKHSLGLVEGLSREQFHVVVFQLLSRTDAVTESLQRRADTHVRLPNRLEVARRMIAEQQLDVLVYTDIGMDPVTYFLAFSRLAHVQCVLPGHPDTTGIPNVDYFISSQQLETADADQHYTERLVRLPGLPTAYQCPEMPTPRPPQDFGLPENGHIYMCAQTLFKIHPDMDQLFAEILRRDPQGYVVLFAGNRPPWTARLKARLMNSLGDLSGRVLLLPRLDANEFRRALLVADAVLDTVHFNGGTTTFEALGVGAPVVTLPGPLMRSRQTLSCYRAMNLLDPVAGNFEDYVNITVRLGTDRDYRHWLREQIEAARPRLFNTAGHVAEMTEFFQAVVASK